MLTRLWGPAAQVSLVITLGLVLAFAAAVGLTLAKFSEALSGAVEARYAIHAADLRANIETGINLGLEVDEIADNLEVVVRNRLALDEGISRIVVTTAEGGEAFAMDRAAAGLAPVAAEAVLSQRSLRVENSFGAEVGEVTVVFVSGLDDARLRDAAVLLLRDVAVLLAVSAVLATLGCLVAMAPLPGAMRRATAHLQDAGDPAPAPPPVEVSGADIEATARAAAQVSRGTLAEIARIEAALTADAERRGA